MAYVNSISHKYNAEVPFLGWAVFHASRFSCSFYSWMCRTCRHDNAISEGEKYIDKSACVSCRHRQPLAAREWDFELSWLAWFHAYLWRSLTQGDRAERQLFSLIATILETILPEVAPGLPRLPPGVFIPFRLETATLCLYVVALRAHSEIKNPTPVYLRAPLHSLRLCSNQLLGFELVLNVDACL